MGEREAFSNKSHLQGGGRRKNLGEESGNEEGIGPKWNLMMIKRLTLERWGRKRKEHALNT